MITITANGKELDLPENIEIDIFKQSDIFEFGQNIIGSGTMPLSLPLTPTNKFIFNYLDREDNSDKTIRERNYNLFYRNNTIVSGTLVAEKTKTSIDTQLALDNGNYYFITQDKTLKQLDLGGEQIFVYKDGGYDAETDHFQLAPVRANNFYKGTPLEVVPGYENISDRCIINYLDPIWAQGFNHWVTISQNPNRYEKGQYAIIPFPYLWYVVEQCFNTYGFTVVYNELKEDADLASLIMFNNYNIVEYERISENSFKQKVDKYNLINHVPEMTIHEFILSVKSFCGAVFDFNGNEVSIKLLEKHIFKGTKIIDLTTKIDNSYKEIVFTKNYDNIEIGAELENTDALTTGQSIYPYKIADANNISSLSNPNAFINSVPSTLTLLYQNLERFYLNKTVLEAGVLKNTFEVLSHVREQKYWSKFEDVVKTTLNDDSTLWNVILWNQYIPSNQYTISSKINSIYLDDNTTYQELTNINVPEGFHMPLVDLPGEHWFNRGENKQETIRLLQYHNIDGTPWTSSDFWYNDFELNNRLSDIRLRYYSELNVFDDAGYFEMNPIRDNCTIIGLYWKSFIEWKLKQSATYYKKAKLSIYEIKNFDFTAKYLIDNTLYYCVSVKAKLTNEGVKECSLTLIPA